MRSLESIIKANKDVEREHGRSRPTWIIRTLAVGPTSSQQRRRVILQELRYRSPVYIRNEAEG